MEKITVPDIKWKRPLPILEHQLEQQPYPIDCLPNIIRNSVVSYQQYGQQPIPLIACGALANISLACQTLANVARDHLLVSPVSLYFLVVANSGERKSAADKAFSYGSRQWQHKTREQLIPDILSSKIIHDTWVAECDGIVKQIRKTGNNGDKTFNLQQKLKELVTQEPNVPLLPELFFEDTTQEAFINNLAHGWPSASLWSDEGSIVLSGHGMQNGATKFISTLNRIWDGNPFITHRKTTRSFTVTNRRLTVSLMLQPLLLEQLLKKNDGVTRQSGFLARSLITQPISSMGERYYKEPSQSLDNLKDFHTRIQECLDLSLILDSRGCHEIPTLSFNSIAKAKWVSFFNEIESGLSNANKWLLIQDFASKSAENIARLSALFHLFQGKDGAITTESVEQAISIIHWHLQETKRILEPMPDVGSLEYTDAKKLLSWLKKKNIQTTTPRFLQQYSPIRERKQRDDALSVLMEYYYVHELIVDDKTILAINPAIYGI